ANERESISEQIISIVNPELPVIETTPEPTKLQTHTLTTAGNIYAKPAAIPLKNKLAILYDKLNPLKNVKPETAHNIKFTLSLLTIIIAFTLIFVGLPIVQTSYHVYKAKGQLANLPNTVATFDTKLAEQQANDAYENLDKAQLILSRIKWFANVTGQTERYTIAQKGLGTGKYLARSMYFASKAAEPYTDLWKIVKPTSEEKLDPEKLANSKLYLREANNQLQLAIADYKGLNKAYIPDMYKDKVLEFENKLGRAEKALGLAEELTKELPDLLGVEGKRKYLVLFQNNNEIRPTGGFVGSYATLELEAGKIIKLEIDDVYNPDGQIDIRKIAVNPPAPIKDLLDEQVLHIRNANWNPSFPKSAQTIEDLFFRIDAREFDGVIAIDLYMLQNLLRVTGPVFITAYNEEITADNVYERTQFHSEFNYEEGSNQKRAFLTLLGSKLLETLFGLDKANVPNLLSTVESALNEKHLMIHLNNNSFNATLAKNNWNGALVTKPGDYLYVVNSNLGGTKANYWVQENMDYKVSSKTRDGLLRAELVLTYTHTGTENKWPNGPYTNYVRVLTKQGAKLTGAQIVTKNRSEELLKKFEEEAAKTTKVNKTDDENDKYIITDEGILIQDVFADIIIAREDTLNSFEQAFTVNPQEIVEFKLEYDLPEQLSVTASNKDYALYWQKQPGTQGDTINFSFEPPFGTSLESVKNMSVVGDTANYTGVLNTD
ncbi:DUF4012 domain-containing protein, partial [candidate division WWE3 bacterium]|nr:DUF4012 domain-containing protein [candidate division WWE3 bacterium]